MYISKDVISVVVIIGFACFWVILWTVIMPRIDPDYPKTTCPTCGHRKPR